MGREGFKPSRCRVFTKVILIDEKGRILILRRSGTAGRRPGGWDLPGGNLEKGERVVESAAREVMEETGLLAERLRPVYVDSGEDLSIDMAQTVAIGLVAGKFGGELRLSYEHDKYLWVTPREFLKLEVGDDGGFLHKLVRAYLIGDAI